MVPSRAAEAGNGHRDSVRIARARRPRRCTGHRAPRLTSGGAPVGGPGGFPRGYKVEVSSGRYVLEHRSPRELAPRGTTVITFASIQTKFVRIGLTESVADAPAWSIQSLRVYAVRNR